MQNYVAVEGPLSCFFILQFSILFLSTSFDCESLIPVRMVYLTSGRLWLWIILNSVHTYRVQTYRGFPLSELFGGCWYRPTAGDGQTVSSVSISRTTAPSFYHDQHDGVESLNHQTRPRYSTS